MRRWLVALLVALLLTSAGVVYAGVSWDDDPHIGHGVWLAWSGFADGPEADWTPDVQFEAKVEKKGGKIKADAKVWTARYKGHGRCTLEARLTDGEGGPVLASASGPCGKDIKVKYRSD